MRYIEDVLAGDSDLPPETVEKYRRFYEDWQKRVGVDVGNGLTEEQAADRWPCAFRVPTDEIVVCQPCQGARTHTLCDCLMLKKKCTVRASSQRGVLTCLTCQEREGQVTAPMDDGRWVVGVTTAPRRGSTLGQCLASLVAAGWRPIVFAEPGTDVTAAKQLGLQVVQWKKRMGCWGNWTAMSRHLIASFPDAEIVMTVQDDTIFHLESKRFAEANGVFPATPETTGFFSFYTAKHYQYRYHVVRPDGSMVQDYPSLLAADKAIKNPKYPGRKLKWVQKPRGAHQIVTRGFWGACALAFPRESLRRIINHRIALEWRGANGNQSGAGIKNSDTAIGKICDTLNLTMWVWQPSLAQHVAKHSTLGHGDNSGRRAAQIVTKDPWKDGIPDQRMTWADMNDLDVQCARLAARLPKDIRAVAGVPRSGLPAAALLAKHLHLPLITIDECMGRTQNSYRPKVSRPILNPAEGKVLIVDDSIGKGKTWKELKPLIKVPFYTATPYSRDQGIQHTDFVGCEIQNPQLFHWQWLSVNSTKLCAFDMDGVICEDWTGPEQAHEVARVAYEDFLRNVLPLHLPRVRIQAIVTGRRERYRAETEEWLSRHGVEHGGLHMLPDDSRLNHAEFKARTLQRLTGVVCFVESSSRQAEHIARVTGRSVLCVENWRMLNGLAPKPHAATQAGHPRPKNQKPVPAAPRVVDEGVVDGGPVRPVTLDAAGLPRDRGFSRRHAAAREPVGEARGAAD